MSSFECFVALLLRLFLSFQSIFASSQSRRLEIVFNSESNPIWYFDSKSNNVSTCYNTLAIRLHRGGIPLLFQFFFAQNTRDNSWNFKRELTLSKQS
mmetsp:Transcript_15982/g.34573  ORF Transcript_15982/g.34573 Transcript_15982/m.34573 type:complete len:97 (+) Transcript_15982:1262-1552(+)